MEHKPDHEPDKLRPYKVREFPQKCGVGDQVVRNACRDGRLKSFRIGREWLILREPEDRLLRGELLAGGVP